MNTFGGSSNHDHSNHSLLFNSHFLNQNSDLFNPQTICYNVKFKVLLHAKERKLIKVWNFLSILPQKTNKYSSSFHSDLPMLKKREVEMDMRSEIEFKRTPLFISERKTLYDKEALKSLAGSVQFRLKLRNEDHLFTYHVDPIRGSFHLSTFTWIFCV